MMIKNLLKTLTLFLLFSQTLFSQVPPIAQIDFDTAEINTPLVVAAPGVLANDSDADGDTITVTQFFVNGIPYNAGQTATFAQGSMTINADGSYTFTPTAGYTGDVPVISYEITDGTFTSFSNLFLTVEHITNLLEITNLSSCNQGYTVDGEYKIRYFATITNRSTARDYHANNLITNIDLTNDLQSVFGTGCVTQVDEINISMLPTIDYVGNPYPMDFDNSDINPNFENVTSNSFFTNNAINTNVLYPRQTVNVSFCVTVNPFCDGRPNPTPSGSGIDFNNTVIATSSIGNSTFSNLITDFHTSEAIVAASLFIPEPNPVVNFDGTYDYTNTVIITNEGTATANNINYNMGLAGFLDNGVSFNTLTVTQVSGPPVTVNSSYNGDSSSQLLTAGNSLAPGETIILEVFTLIGAISSTDENYYYQMGNSMTQGPLDGFDETLSNNNRRYSYVTWNDGLGGHLDRFYIASSATDVPTSSGQCGCLNQPMVFTFTSSSTNNKTITNTDNTPNGITEHEELTFQLTATNTSAAVQLENLQMQDDLNSICGGNIISVSTPTIASSTAISNPNLNPGFNGTTDINLFDGTSGILEPNQSITIEFTVVFNEDCLGTNFSTFSGTDPLNNIATSFGSVSMTATTDSDNDGISNVNDIDDDNDTIPDTVEYNGIDPTGDADGDFIPNYRDLDFGTDANGDGIVDLFDFDNDGVPNHFDLDSDGDGILDIVEVGNSALDTNSNGETNNPVGGNGLDNTIETNDSFSANITYIIPNTDGTTNPDYLDIDADGDGIVDNIEGQATDAYVAPSGTISSTGIDTAYPNGISPVDTEGDTIFDYLDLNSDDDIRDDYIEGWDLNNDGTPETIASGIDTDNDGLDNAYDNLDNQINPTNGQVPNDFPNVDNTTTPERDWREIIAIVVLISDVTGNEGGDLNFTISLVTMNDNTILVQSATPITIDLFTSDGTDTTTQYEVAITPFDYNQVTTTTLTIPAFQDTDQFIVSSLDDNIYELDEKFTLNGNITSNNTINSEAKGIGTIIDNESPPSIFMNDSREDEGVDLPHTITLSHPCSTPINISVSTSDLTAISPDDYATVVESLVIDGTIDPNAANLDVSFSIPTFLDNLNEPLEELLSVRGTVTTTNVGTQDLDKTGTIVDIDPDPIVAISDATVVEGNTLIFTISLLNASSEPMLNYQAIDMVLTTLNGTAIAPNDFSFVSVPVSIPAFTASIDQSVITLDDELNEEAETMTLQVSIISNNVSNTSSIVEGTGTIKDNDIPNLFSPNGDGKSDFFKISGIEDFPDFTLVIYDRWGSEVYNYSNKGNLNPIWWDGNYKGKPVPEGVYFYTLDFNDGTTKPKTNFIELIR